jgi:hypothetical protein
MRHRNLFGGSILIRASVFLATVLAVTVPWLLMIRMPGRSFRGQPPPLSAEQMSLRTELVAHVGKLAGDIGERNVVRYTQLKAAADYIEQTFSAAGLRTRRDGYDVQGKTCENIEAEITGKQPEIVVVGAHYDSVIGCPGANDNGSGAAALLALARRFAAQTPTRTLRFVALTNEEPIYFQTEQMGSWVYASRCKARGEKIVAMISLETIGYFSNSAGSQKYPMPGLGAIYPTTGNFISFVGDVSSRRLVRQAIGTFRQHAQIPSEGAALPSAIPGVGWSDQWAFWQHGYRGIMITDTAPFRYPHYHEPTDTPDKIDLDSMTRVVDGMRPVIENLGTPD